MEQHSIHAGILLTSRVYWRYFKENRFKNQGEDYTSSIPNIRAIFKEAYRILKPGGAIISQIEKRKHSALDRSFLENLGPRQITERLLDRLSSIVTVVK